MKIGGVDFPEPLLNALRDGKLVVFAGAGVSMGPPARLPSFRELAEKVAEGTGKSIEKSEPVDHLLVQLEDFGDKIHQFVVELFQSSNLEPNSLRNLFRIFVKTRDISENEFLERLEDLGGETHRLVAELLQSNNPESNSLRSLLRIFEKTNDISEDKFLGQLEKDPGVKVHQRAADILQKSRPKYNPLHKDLLRLFKEHQQMRIVTTNFDHLFEQAAEKENMFKIQPKVFEAPALPLGSDFQGIVHLHGSVNEPEKMVLTHRDFGRAYLTEEDGWARRFLVSLFANHTVLFVGYSHSDTIMTYLTPSLPPDGGEKRFALVGSTSNDLDRWHRMGIEPIKFHQQNEGDFTGAYIRRCPSRSPLKSYGSHN